MLHAEDESTVGAKPCVLGVHGIIDTDQIANVYASNVSYLCARPCTHQQWVYSRTVRRPDPS
jgi:hypothetical protein